MHYCNEPLESQGSKDLSNIDLKDVRGGGGPHKLNNYFSLQNIMSPVVILSSVPRTFSQDCRYEVEKQANEKQERKLNDCFESVGW